MRATRWLIPMLLALGREEIGDHLDVVLRNRLARHGGIAGVERLAAQAGVDGLRVGKPLHKGLAVILFSHLRQRGRAAGNVAAWAAEMLKGLLALGDLMVAIEDGEATTKQTASTATCQGFSFNVASFGCL